MPFHNGTYYPFTSDSSAGIPSLLNSPLSQHSTPGMTPSTGGVLPFRFRPRRERVDWRRLNDVDVDLVASQMDVDTLQEHITNVTFCSLEDERCQRCHSPVAPALVKLLRLAQLSMEWLLHCQEFLAVNMRTLEEKVEAGGKEQERLLAQQKEQEERVAAGGREQERLLAQQKEQEEKVKVLTTELKQRRKIIKMQQTMFTPKNYSGQKCPHCNKSFLNSTFLQSHMQRRHPDEYETELKSVSEMKSQVERLKLEISSLKEQIVQQHHDLQTKTDQEKEQQLMHKDVQRELERFKAEETARTDRKIEDSRDSIRREMELLYSRNVQALNEANQNHAVRMETAASPVHSQPDNYREMQTPAMQKLQQQLKMQDKKWEKRLQEIKTQHESEKNQLLNELSRKQSENKQLLQEELSRMQEVQENNQLLQQELSRMQSEYEERLQEREQTIKVQREQMRNISSHPPTKIMESPVMVGAPAPERRPKRVVLEEPVSAPKLDPIQELSEEEKDSSSFSERRPVEKKPEPVPENRQRSTSSALKRNPNIKKEMRPDVVQALIEKLENLGVKPDQSGLKDKELNSILAKVRSKRKSVAKGIPEYWRHLEEIKSTMEQLVSQRRGRDSAPESQTRSRQSVQVLQIRPQSSSRPSRAAQVKSGPAIKQPVTPQPALRIRTATQPKTSTPKPKPTPRTFTPKTPPFSSAEESEEEDSEEEQPQIHQRGKSPQPRPNQVQTRASKTSPVQTWPAPAKHSSSNFQQTKGSVTKTAVTKMESDEEEDDEEWSQVSELQEIDPKRLQSYRDQNGNVEKRNFGKENKINNLARKMEKSFAERSIKKPAGGVSILPERKDDVQELTYTDLEDSSEWVVSSLEDKQEVPKPAQGSGPMRKSQDSPSTSIWGTSTGKAPKSGLTEAGTGSTLKSSLCSLSDISDSEDISNKYN